MCTIETDFVGRFQSEAQNVPTATQGAHRDQPASPFGPLGAGRTAFYRIFAKLFPAPPMALVDSGDFDHSALRVLPFLGQGGCMAVLGGYVPRVYSRGATVNEPQRSRSSAFYRNPHQITPSLVSLRPGSVLLRLLS